MGKRNIILCGLVVLAITSSSCLFDPKPAPPKPPVPPKSYENLTERWHVLNNLEKLYNDRNINRYDEILDQSFMFFLAQGDVGGNIPAQWDRRDEIDQVTFLFDRNLSHPEFPRCKSIVMDVQFEGVLQWQAVVRPDETWYETVVFYDFIIQVEPDVTYIPEAGAKARFTVRNAGTELVPRWQLVEWQDLGKG